MSTTTNTSTIYNCVSYAGNGGGGNGNFNPYASALPGDTATVNATFYNCAGFDGQSDGLEFEPSVAGGGGTETANETNYSCASSDGSADDYGGTGNIVTQSSSSCFVSATTGDFRLRLNGNLIGAGTNLSGTNDTDIGTNSRPASGVYTIGAWIPIMWRNQFFQ